MNGWINDYRQMNGKIDEWVHRQIDGSLNGQTERQMDQ